MPGTDASVAAVIVTHNSERWLNDLVASIEGQTRRPDAVLCVDDASTDATPDILTAAGFTVATATSSAQDVNSRIAQNFVQGLRLAREFDIAVLSDHDDYWLPDRVEHQVRVLQDYPDAWLVASGGRIMGSDQRLRDTFPVPEDWEDMSRGKQIRYALRHSIATGGASAVRPGRLLDPINKATPVPTGWLHDRWWSLAATASSAIVIDEHPVIEYRVQPDQEVGLARGRQGSRVPRVGFGDVRRARAVARLLT